MTGDDVIDVPGADPVDSGTTDPHHRRGGRGGRAGRGRRAALTGLAVVAVLVVALVTMAVLSIGPFSTRTLGLTSFDAVRTGYGPDADRTLVVAASGGTVGLTDDDPCWIGFRAEAEEVDVVDVALHERGPSMYATFRHRTQDCVSPSPQEMLTLVLAAPRAGRPVVDRATGTAVPVFDGRTLLRPASLPSGWSPQSEVGTVIDGAPTWSRAFGTIDPNARVMPPADVTPQWVVLTQAAPTRPAIEPGTRIDGRPAVRGTTGEYFDEGASRTLTWDEGGQRILLRAGAANGAPLLSEAELVALAESLVPEG